MLSGLNASWSFFGGMVLAWGISTYLWTSRFCRGSADERLQLRRLS